MSGALRDEWKWIKMNYLVLIKIFIEKYTFIFINIHASDLIRNIKLISHMTQNIVNRCVIVKNSVNHALSFLIVCIYQSDFYKLPFLVDSGPFRLNLVGLKLEAHFSAIQYASKFGHSVPNGQFLSEIILKKIYVGVPKC